MQLLRPPSLLARLRLGLLLLLLLLSERAIAGKDLYSVLGVRRGASDDEIKKAYRKGSLKFHPDRVHDESKKAEAQKRFTDIAGAYETLSDPEKRRIYDQTGDDGSQAEEAGFSAVCLRRNAAAGSERQGREAREARRDGVVQL